MNRSKETNNPTIDRTRPIIPNTLRSIRRIVVPIRASEEPSTIDSSQRGSPSDRTVQVTKRTRCGIVAEPTTTVGGVFVRVFAVTKTIFDGIERVSATHEACKEGRAADCTSNLSLTFDFVFECIASRWCVCIDVVEVSLGNHGLVCVCSA